MKRRIDQSLLASCFLSLVLLAVGGCPLAAPPVNDIMLGPEPGTYYVERLDGKLFYYQLERVRGEDGNWVLLNEDGDWYEGTGFYELSEDYDWSWDEDAEGLTLDELIQLHDPPPPAP